MRGRPALLWSLWDLDLLDNVSAVGSVGVVLGIEELHLGSLCVTVSKGESEAEHRGSSHGVGVETLEKESVILTIDGGKLDATNDDVVAFSLDDLKLYYSLVDLLESRVLLRGSLGRVSSALTSLAAFVTAAAASAATSLTFLVLRGEAEGDAGAAVEALDATEEDRARRGVDLRVVSTCGKKRQLA